MGWTDAAGHLWLFGGTTISGNGLGARNDLWMFDPDTLQWTRVGGSTQLNAPANYGTQSVAATTNDPGGRAYAATWMDASGNLWLFGGDVPGSSGASDTSLGDVWKYDIASREWTWVSGSNQPDSPAVYGTQGVSAATNSPPAGYGNAYWQDAMARFWLMDANANLWEYSASTGQWAGVLGPQYGSYSNQVPGPRLGPTGGYDAVHSIFLLFGGTSSYPAGSGPAAGDVWSFDGSAWTDGGASEVSGPAPAARNFPEGWMDQAGTLWVYGGWYYAPQAGSMPASGQLSKFMPAGGGGGTWTQVTGDIETSVYGTLGVPDPSNSPGPRGAATAWVDGHGNFWFFGGTSLNELNDFDDLWEYVP